MNNSASIATIVRVPYVVTLTHTDDFLYATVDVAIWSTVEPGIGITVLSLATLRPLLRSCFSRIGLKSSVDASTQDGSTIRRSVRFSRNFRIASPRDLTLNELVEPGTMHRRSQMRSSKSSYETEQSGDLEKGAGIALGPVSPSAYNTTAPLPASPAGYNTTSPLPYSATTGKDAANTTFHDSDGLAPISEIPSRSDTDRLFARTPELRAMNAFSNKNGHVRLGSDETDGHNSRPSDRGLANWPITN